jgi:GT2 family glycosyltransferase
MITYLLPTRDRHQTLARTLEAIGSLNAADHEMIGGGEVIVVDNASTPPVLAPEVLRNGLPVRVIRLVENIGAAARNIGAQEARGEWIVMLDDDSHPMDCGHISVLMKSPPDVAAIGAEIFLQGGTREAGGLPEIIIGCGAAIRRDMFLAVGGYDPSFDYYVEEYDLCAKFLIRGWRVVHDRRFRVLHEKITTHRDMNRILHRLVRNNGWVTQRYSPSELRQAELENIICRYASIALKEHASRGFAAGMAELMQSLEIQPSRTMSQELFDRFTGLAHVRTMVANEPLFHSSNSIAIVNEGKNVDVIRKALEDVGATLVQDERDADVLMIGTLSPGPMLDAWEQRVADPRTAGRPVLCGWHLQGSQESAGVLAA